jgi:hypothetical protein
VEISKYYQQEPIYLTNQKYENTILNNLNSEQIIFWYTLANVSGEFPGQ